MTNQENSDSALSPYRVLDLTEGGCMIGGRILGDLGADVIKIEPPGGSPSRIAPFYRDIAHPEKSIFWFAYNVNKRSITLDLIKKDGQEIFKKLVDTADIVMESFPAGYMSQLGIGYEHLTKINADLIMASITPFGQDGPKAHYQGSDLTAWASGVYLYMCGEPDQPPVWMSFPQAALHGGAEASAGIMAALWHRRMTGEGQYVDVSLQECVIACNFNTAEIWDVNKIDVMRSSRSINRNEGSVRTNVVWKCKDGYVVIVVAGGHGPFASSSKELVKWMDEEGMADDWIKEMDWINDYDILKLTTETVNNVRESVQKFLLTKTKKELYEEGALKRKILFGPLFDSKEISENIQLQARDFWIPVEHTELSDTIYYPGPFAKLSENQISYRRPPPLIGEHNIEVYYEELGLTRQELILLKQAAVI